MFAESVEELEDESERAAAAIEASFRCVFDACRVPIFPFGTKLMKHMFVFQSCASLAKAPQRPVHRAT